MGNKLQKGGSNPRPPTKPSSNIMLNDQLSYKLKLIGLEFNMNIMNSIQNFRSKDLSLMKEEMVQGIRVSITDPNLR